LVSGRVEPRSKSSVGDRVARQAEAAKQRLEGWIGAKVVDHRIDVRQRDAALSLLHGPLADTSPPEETVAIASFEELHVRRSRQPPFWLPKLHPDGTRMPAGDRIVLPKTLRSSNGSAGRPAIRRVRCAPPVLNRLDLPPWLTACLCTMHEACMSTKTISVKIEAYERLRAARRYPDESFSEVVLRARWPEDTVTAGELRALAGIRRALPRPRVQP